MWIIFCVHILQQYLVDNIWANAIVKSYECWVIFQSLDFFWFVLIIVIYNLLALVSFLRVGFLGCGCHMHYSTSVSVLYLSDAVMFPPSVVKTKDVCRHYQISLRRLWSHSLWRIILVLLENRYLANSVSQMNKVIFSCYWSSFLCILIGKFTYIS